MVYIMSYPIRHNTPHRIWLFHRMTRALPWYSIAYQTPITGMYLDVTPISFTRIITNSNETRTALTSAVIVLYTIHIYISFAQKLPWLHLTTKNSTLWYNMKSYNHSSITGFKLCVYMYFCRYIETWNISWVKLYFCLQWLLDTRK